MTEQELDELRAQWFSSGWQSALKEIKLRLEIGHNYTDLLLFCTTQLVREEESK